MTITNEDLMNITELRDELVRYKPEIVSNDLITDNNGKIIKGSVANVSAIFAHDDNLKDLFRYNEFTGNVELYKGLDALKLRPNDIEKADVQVQSYIEKHFHVCFEDRILKAGKMNYIYNTRYDAPYNPMKDYLEDEEWDGKHRIDTFFIDYLGAEDNRLNREISRKFLIGAVGRILTPGLKVELVPILVGKQGRGKSTLCSALCPLDDKGQPKYFLANLPSLSGDNKDNYQLIHDNWIVEIGELDAMSKTKIESTKAFISETKDQYRPPYASVAKSCLRSNVFIGTTNTIDFLRDRTGNRRFLPIEIDKQERTKDVFNIDRHDIAQVLAEAVYYFKDDEKPVLSSDVMDDLKEVQSKHMITDVDEDRIKEFAELLVPDDWEQYTLYEKTRYFDRYIDESIYKDASLKEIPTSKLHPIKRFNAEEVVACVFNDNRTIKGKLSKKISSVMQSLDNFEYKTYRVKIAKQSRLVRGYVRK